MNRNTVAVILPALNEVSCVRRVVEDFLHEGTRVVVVDNGSTDGTGRVAEKAGAEVVYEEAEGYGNACLAGLSYLSTTPPEIVVFADCDGTLDANDLWRLVDPINSGDADLVLGRRARVERGSLPMHQRFGNTIACFLFGILYGLSIRDIPPYRAANWSFMERLGLSQRTCGLPVETVALTALRNGRIKEVDVSYRVRIGGRSKVAGSFSGAIKAGGTMLSLLIGLWFRSFAD